MGKSGNTEGFGRRFERHADELRELYMGLYGNEPMYAELCGRLKEFYEERSQALKERDQERERHSDWYKGNDLLGMMFYIDNFAGNLRGVEEKPCKLYPSDAVSGHAGGALRRRVRGLRFSEGTKEAGDDEGSGTPDGRLP